MKHRADVTDRTRLWAVGNVFTGTVAPEDKSDIALMPREEQTAGRLRELGCEVYVPVYQKWVRSKRWRREKARKILKPGFPGYVFVRQSTIGNLEEIYSTPGFHYFLRYADSGELKLVPDAVISEIRSMKVFLPADIEDLVERFEIGQQVRVIDGPFGGMRGKVKADRKTHATVDGGDFKHPTEIPVKILEAV